MASDTDLRNICPRCCGKGYVGPNDTEPIRWSYRRHGGLLFVICTGIYALGVVMGFLIAR